MLFRSKFSISVTGDVSQSGQLRGRLRVVEFNDPKLLQNTGGGFFLANNSKIQTADAAQPNVRQGVLEMSNASTITEMTNLITAMRFYEMNQRVVQAQDERMGKAISELASPS